MVSIDQEQDQVHHDHNHQDGHETLGRNSVVFNSDSVFSKESPASSWHVDEAHADVFENIVWVDLASEFDTVDCGCWVKMGAKILPVIQRLIHSNVIIFIVGFSTIGGECLLSAH